MKKLISFFVFFFIFSLPVSATTITPPVRNQERKEIRQEAREEVKEIRQEKKAALTEIKQKRIQNVFDAIKKGLIKRHESLLKIKDKISARISKNPMNKDTTQAKVELAKFDAAESSYQTDLASLNARFEELKNSSKPADLLKNLRDSVNLVKKDLNNIKTILKTTVNILAKAPKLQVTPTK